METAAARQSPGTRPAVQPEYPARIDLRSLISVNFPDRK
jgi:hypothetical protein